ncbi:MAG TPA: proteasome assembly chaperone family protein [Acidilobales archaeon]|nr:MAG: carboxylate--amine ligase [Desulfurococcales archaeon ex4484_42]HDN75633.1 proteasome assembly chaperone family protein [Acidilobales archaeon]
MVMVKILVKGEFRDSLKGREWVTITGFPGFGFTGYITCRYIAVKLGAIKIGNIIATGMPDFTFIDDYGLASPHEILADFKNGIIIVINHINPKTMYRAKFSIKLAEWFKSIGVKEVFLIGGLDIRFKEGKGELMWLTTSTCKRRLKEPRMEKGLYIVGPLASLITVFESEGIPALILLPFVEPSRPEPRAAAIAIRKINELLNLNIPVSELLEHAKVIEETESKLRELERKLQTEERGMRTYI